ncbi:MAG: ribosomal protein large subunit ribosomal protein [Parcubacteria group bacterium]|nr:ribosomal protein large subunit ribosomal protein [Parcubacteria group bacterium]
MATAPAKKVTKKAPTKKVVANKASGSLTRGKTVAKAAPEALEEKVAKTVAPAAGTTEATVYSMAGAKAGTIALPAELFGASWNADLVHQVVVGMQANARQIVAHTKFRGEVSGGGKKPWKQKGTGRARHGSTRSPIWKGGGVTHGPRAEKVYAVKINRKMRAAALASVLSRKLRDGEIIFVDSFAFSAPSTKDAMGALRAIATAAGQENLVMKRKNAAIIAIATKDANIEKSFRNIGSLITEEIRNLNPVDLMTKKYLVIEKPNESLAVLSARFTKSA